MYDELKAYFLDKLLSKCQCKFRKWFTTQHCLLAIIKKLRKSFDSKGLQLLFWLTSLKRLIVCRMTAALTAKLHAYGIKKEFEFVVLLP